MIDVNLPAMTMNKAFAAFITAFLAMLGINITFGVADGHSLMQAVGDAGWMSSLVVSFITSFFTWLFPNRPK